jgi:hypothetical protein
MKSRLTNSRMKAYRMCPRYHSLSYIEGWRPRVTAPALSFGTAFHTGMEAYWRGEEIPTAILTDDYESAKVNALVAGYQARWEDEDRAKYAMLAVEKEFEVPLIHPVTGEEHPHWTLAGKIDLLIAEGDAIVLCDHKTSSEDISLGSTFWQRLPLDTQILIYLYGARHLGFEVSKILWDVAAKPRQRPKKGETPNQFQTRIMGEIAADPAKFYARAELFRFDHEIEAALLDAWDFADRMHADMQAKWNPRNIDSCFKYGRPCSFFRFCLSNASPCDDMDFVKLADPNPELSNQQQEEAA